MSLQERVQSDIAAAMRSGDSLRRDVLRMVASAAYNVEKRQGRPLSDAEYLDVLAREVKSRRESVEAFRNGGREDLASKEAAEIEIISGYLPQQLSDIEAGSIIQAIVHEINAQTMKDMGRVMATLKERYAGKLDFSKASAAVKKALSGG